MTYENYVKFVSVSINKGYWNTATFISLRIVDGYFHSILAERHRCDRDHVGHGAENIYYPATPTLDLCASLCGSETNSTSITRELIKKAESWSPSQNLNQNLHSNSVIHLHMKV